AEGRADLVRRAERITGATLARQLAVEAPPFVLDVRSPGEWRESRIAGSTNVPLDHLRERIADVPRDVTLVIHCGSGYRSPMGASILAQHGIESIDLVGGMGAWEAAKLPTVSGEGGGKAATK